MLMIRLQRVGRKHEPTFRIVVTDKQNGPKSGKSLEVVGSYDSRRAEKAEFKADRIKEWMSKGAKLSGTIHNLLVSRKVIEGKKINVLPKKKPIKPAPTEASGEEAKKEEKKEEVKAEEVPTRESAASAGAAPEVPAPVAEKVAEAGAPQA